jgi:hypothetical protein
VTSGSVIIAGEYCLNCVEDYLDVAEKLDIDVTTAVKQRMITSADG